MTWPRSYEPRGPVQHVLRVVVLAATTVLHLAAEMTGPRPPVRCGGCDRCVARSRPATRPTVGGYPSSDRQANDLAPPPRGPAPGSVSTEFNRYGTATAAERSAYRPENISPHLLDGAS